MKRIVPYLALASLISSCSHSPVEPLVADAPFHELHSPEMQRAIAQSRDRRRPNYGGRYDGPPPGEFKRDQWDRRPQAASFMCQKYKDATAKHVLVCNAGIEEGQAMAAKIAASHGREDGYMKGYAWGLNQSAYFYQNSPEEIARGEQSVGTLDSNLVTAVNEGQSSGNRDGDSLGASDVKGKFYRAVDTKVMPAPEYQVPATNFNPTQDAYARYIGRVPTVEDILKRDRFGKMKFYDSYDRTYGGGPGWRERSGRDLWSKEGIYSQNANVWVDGSEMFKYWLDASGGARRKYDMLNNQVSFNEMKTARMPAQERERRPPSEGGNGGTPGNGGPGRGNGGSGNGPGTPTPTPTPTPPVVVVTPAPVTPIPVPPPVAVVDYQAIFKDAYINSYNNYAPSEYSRAYYSTIDNGQNDGENDGAEIGVEIAYYKGLEASYNRKYAFTSQNSYRNGFATSYGNAYNKTYAYYKNTAILSLNFLGVNGLDEDGVIQPGEDLSAFFKVTNVGGVPSKLTYSLSGDIQNASSLSDVVDPISTKSIHSPKIGEVLNTLDNGANASYTLKVNGLEERLGQEIKRPLQFQNITANVSPLEGTGMYVVTISNISTVALNGTISLDLMINGKVAKTTIGSAMQPGEKKTYSLDFSGLDPLQWMKKQYSTEVLLKYNNIIYVRRAFGLDTDDYAAALTQYFARLVNEKGIFPATTNADTRKTEVKSLIVTANIDEVKSVIDGNGNPYKESPERTIPGKVLAAKTGYVGGTASAKSEFIALADIMAVEGKKFKSFLGIAPKRSAFYDIMKNIGEKKYK